MGESVQLSESALSLIDLKSAAIDESDFFSGFLPRGSAEDVFKNRGPELEAMMRSQLQSGFEIFEPEVLFASKAVRGNRPFSVLDISQRLLYAGLTSTLQTHLPPLNRSQESFDEFKSAPLEFSTTGFVVMADVAACYQFIDHGILETELLARTAETEWSKIWIAPRKSRISSAGRCCA
jgi:RNA-directed DNA polymerase